MLDEKVFRAVQRHIVERYPFVISGLDTFYKAKEPITTETKITDEFIEFLDKIQNESYLLQIAIILYCMYCSFPLNWHWNSPDNLKLSCPKCGSKWYGK